MVGLHPESGNPRRILRPGFLVAGDEGNSAKEMIPRIGDKRCRNRIVSEAFLDKIAEQAQRVPLLLPECTPDAICDDIDEILSLAQIADRHRAQRSVSRSLVISCRRGAMDEIRPYSLSVCAPS